VQAQPLPLLPQHGHLPARAAAALLLQELLKRATGHCLAVDLLLLLLLLRLLLLLALLETPSLPQLLHCRYLLLLGLLLGLQTCQHPTLALPVLAQLLARLLLNSTLLLLLLLVALRRLAAAAAAAAAWVRSGSAPGLVGICASAGPVQARAHQPRMPQAPG
jgi:hypothetical protein